MCAIQYGTREDEPRAGARLARTFSLKAQAGPVWSAQDTLGSPSPLSTWAQRPPLTKVVEVLEHSVQKRVRPRRGGARPRLPRHRGVSLSWTPQSPPAGRRAAPHFRVPTGCARAAGPRAASVRGKMAAPGVLWSGRRGCRRLRRGRAALRGRTAPSCHTTSA